MRNPFTPLAFFLGLLGSLALGCSSDSESSGSPDGGGGDAGGGPSSGRLDADAVAELEALGVRDYEGKAVVTGETAQGDITRVTFDPDSGPICLRGGEFALFYEDRASTEGLVIILDGGGACWTGFCLASETADETLAGYPPVAAPGADNLFGDWDVISVPYCDGSVFAGDNEVTEEDGTTRYHHGRQNLGAAVDIALEKFPNASKILLTGFSAGGFGTISGSVAFRLAFPDADLYVLNDSGPGIQNLSDPGTEIRLEEWRFQDVIPASCTACNGGRGQLTEMIGWMLDHDSTVKVSMLSYLGDDVIGDTFLKLSNPEFEALLLEETDKLNDRFPDRLKRFMLPGDGHVLQPTYGSLEVGGVLQKDWVEAMVSGDDATWIDIVEPTP